MQTSGSQLARFWSAWKHIGSGNYNHLITPSYQIFLLVQTGSVSPTHYCPHYTGTFEKEPRWETRISPGRGLLLKLFHTLQCLFKLFVLVCWHFKNSSRMFIISLFRNNESTDNIFFLKMCTVRCNVASFKAHNLFCLLFRQNEDPDYFHLNSDKVKPAQENSYRNSLDSEQRLDDFCVNFLFRENQTVT